jgi:hypothetical protein
MVKTDQAKIRMMFDEPRVHVRGVVEYYNLKVLAYARDQGRHVGYPIRLVFEDRNFVSTHYQNPAPRVVFGKLSMATQILTIQPFSIRACSGVAAN